MSPVIVRRVLAVLPMMALLALGGCSFAFSQQRSVRLTPAPTHDSLEAAMRQVSGLRDLRREEEAGGVQRWSFAFAGSLLQGRLRSGPTGEVVQIEAGVSGKGDAQLRAEALRLLDHLIRELEILLPATARLSDDWQGPR